MSEPADRLAVDVNQNCENQIQNTNNNFTEGKLRKRSVDSFFSRKLSFYTYSY